MSGIPPQKKLGIGILVNDVDEATPQTRSAAGAGPVAETEALAATAAANPKRKAMEAYGGMSFGRPEKFGVLMLTE